jgi:P-type conjugative transfer protein TrbJ
MPMPRRRSWIAAALTALTLLVVPPAAHAQFGLPFGGPTIVYDPAAVGKLIDQHIAVSRDQLQAQIIALRKLTSPPWRDITAAMAQIDALTRQGEAVAYSLRNVDALFSATYAGIAVAGNAPAVETLQAARTLATLRGVLNAAARAAVEFPVGTGRLAEMKRQMGQIEGHEQALELNGAIGVYTAEQLTLLSQQLAALTNAQAVYFADVVNDRAQTRANTRAFLAKLGEIPASRPGFSFRP